MIPLKKSTASTDSINSVTDSTIHWCWLPFVFNYFSFLLGDIQDFHNFPYFWSMLENLSAKYGMKKSRFWRKFHTLTYTGVSASSCSKEGKGRQQQLEDWCPNWRVLSLSVRGFLFGFWLVCFWSTPSQQRTFPLVTWVPYSHLWP